MEILLLGTGSADGWPNPFCRCASCRWAAAEEIRGQTAALVDDTVLLDCGPETPRAAVRCGRSLADVGYILFTHGHFDHVGPAALLMRHWSGHSRPLQVLGPPSALRHCRDWVGPDDPVRFRTVGPGDEVDLSGDYRVRVLPAAHGAELGGEAVLYDLATPGSRILWATDTGPLPADTHAAVAGARYGAVFLEETFGPHTEHGTEHHDLPAFAATLARLRQSGAVVEGTDVVAVHLSHHNPPGRDLAGTLARWGARPGRDGEIVRAGPPHPVPACPVRTLVLGGARSGKSAYAESTLAAEPEVIYLATGGAGDDDPDWTERVRRHRARRPESWRTVETTDVAAQLRIADAPVLLDCLGTWLTARIDGHRAWDGRGLDAVHTDIDELVAAWRDCPVPVVAVSNEVGSGVVPATASGRLFRDLLGVANARIAGESENVVLLVAGVPVPLHTAVRPG
jgi:adenosylcobinamide kinase/adenosylcobinamide-phosphate guanylyltransferase